MSVFQILAQMLQIPDLASKKWIYQQYDSQVMNDTLQTGGDASVVRIRGGKKAVAISTDCTPRYVEADPFEGAIQAVAETYRNISAVGARPLAITNCLNFGNPQKPEIMGQIVRSIRGITAASKALDYPVVSGNVSLYNETDGKAIQPTPAIGGVGLLTDFEFMVSSKFKKIGDEMYLIGKTYGHLDCSLFQREILGVKSAKNPPKCNLLEERKNGEFVRQLAEKKLISACHDISDGGLLVALFEMCSDELGCNIDISDLLSNFQKHSDDKILEIFFGEDQSRYLLTVNSKQKNGFIELADKAKIDFFKIGEVGSKAMNFKNETISVSSLRELCESVFSKKFD